MRDNDEVLYLCCHETSTDFFRGLDDDSLNYPNNHQLITETFDSTPEIARPAILDYAACPCVKRKVVCHFRAAEHSEMKSLEVLQGVARFSTYLYCDPNLLQLFLHPAHRINYRHSYITFNQQHGLPKTATSSPNQASLSERGPAILLVSLRASVFYAARDPTRAAHQSREGGL